MVQRVVDSTHRPEADVCLILEGTYPYITGGVSTWTHDLIRAHADLSFHIVTLLPSGAPTELRYEIPHNVTGHFTVFVQKLPDDRRIGPRSVRFMRELEKPLMSLISTGGLGPLASVLKALEPFRNSGRLLMNSPAAWDLLVSMYQQTHSQCSFLDYFWSWRAMLGGLYSVLLADLPRAKVYHTVSTGYAGLMAARARVETGRPVLLTEHGIYTNERRIEISMADWLHGDPPADFDLERSRATLKNFWINGFVGYSRACYEAAERIITLYEGNQQLQLQDGADPEKVTVIPNGIDYRKFSSIPRDPRRPTVALIGRVTPIKDVKTFVRACGILRDLVADVHCLVLGPTDEDPEYFRECEALVLHLGLSDTVTFAGRVALDDHLGRIDVMTLTSISEAQPLTILEAGAAGIPSVATDVGACREMILGRSGETPALGPGGAITPLCSPAATAASLARLLSDRDWHEQCSKAMRARVQAYYNKTVVDIAYRSLYDKCLEKRVQPQRVLAWQE